MLRFPKGPAPKKVLTEWQATPKANWNSLHGADKDEVRDATLRDQGHLCAYCQRRIRSSDKYMKIEHWHAQSGGEGMLRWHNLLGVCLGDERKESGIEDGELHCDTVRGDAKLFLHPVEGQGPNPQEYLRYTSEGEARTAREKTEVAKAVQGDIDALNLNARRLRRARTVVCDELRRRLDRAKWGVGALRAEYRAAAILPGSKAPEQCEVVRYHIRRWARQKNVEL